MGWFGRDRDDDGAGHGRAGRPEAPLTAAAVRASTFTPVKFREGYDMAEVDDFLDRVADRLTELEARLAAGDDDPTGG